MPSEEIRDGTRGEKRERRRRNRRKMRMTGNGTKLLWLLIQRRAEALQSKHGDS